MAHFFSLLFILACFGGIGFWLYGLFPLLRVWFWLHKNPSRNSLGEVYAILKDDSHPLYPAVKKAQIAYGAFAGCWLLGVFIFFTFLRH